MFRIFGLVIMTRNKFRKLLHALELIRRQEEEMKSMADTVEREVAKLNEIKIKTRKRELH